VAAGGEARSGEPPSNLGKKPAESLGHRLFVRHWTPEDPRSHGGDGLGPVFNERSCVACHSLGGVGGAGPKDRNVTLLTANPIRPRIDPADEAPTPPPVGRSGLAAIHPGLATAGSVVLHKLGVSPSYEAWRKDVLTDRGTTHEETPLKGRAGSALPPTRTTAVKANTGLPREVLGGKFRLVKSERNTPALFGAGLIDLIPDSAIEAEATRQSKARPAIVGRPARNAQGRVGKFGWKGQVASLEEFVLNACAVEIGLEVPNHTQAKDPLGYGDHVSGLDMTGEECDALIGFVRDLPAPDSKAWDGESKGRAIFKTIGCADCHKPSLGNVDGIYSDLLLHDMGENLSDSGTYYGTETDDGNGTPGAPKMREWKTPPLWGVASSSPYLHDGRAKTIVEAISLHGGQAVESVNKFHALGTDAKRMLSRFLNSLTAPLAARLAPAMMTRSEVMEEWKLAASLSHRFPGAGRSNPWLLWPENGSGGP
jgi:CxxC motif-containing protein (DUF1111 family)